jgi:hypothetical protein
MLRRLMVAVALLVSLPTWAQGVFPYPLRMQRYQMSSRNPVTC